MQVSLDLDSGASIEAGVSRVSVLVCAIQQHARGRGLGLKIENRAGARFSQTTCWGGLDLDSGGSVGAG